MQPIATTGKNSEQFGSDGFTVVRNLFSQSEADHIRDVFMQQMSDGPIEGLSDLNKSYLPGDPLAKYPRMLHPHLHDDKLIGPLAMSVMLDQRLEPILRELFGEEPFAVQSMFYFKPPGARGQDLHQDNFY